LNKKKAWSEVMVSRKFCRAERVRLAFIALSASALAAVLLPVQFATPAEAKTPGKTYCYYGKCHRVKTIEETQALVGVEETITASHYDDCAKDRYNPCGLTSSGERFHPNRPDNTASPIYPDGTMLLVWSPDNERALVVRVNNAGPYWGDRVLDLSRAAAEKLGFEGKGVATLKVRVVKAPEPEEAAYVENRNYKPVPGDIGEYDSLKEAETGMAVALALQASAASPLAPVTTANAFASGTEGSEMLVAEAPQAMGHQHLQLASMSAPNDFTSLTLSGRGAAGSLFKGLKLKQSTAQSRYALASLSLNHELNSSQTVWDEDPPESTGSLADTPVAREESSEPSSDETAKAAAAETQRAAQQRRERKEAAAEEEAAEERVARRKSRERTERRSRSSTAANSERRRSRAQVAFAERSYERRPERSNRSTEQITSLGIRASVSSVY
jgi:rare lipoprotein A (peptidoglycan hydrolase)